MSTNRFEDFFQNNSYLALKNHLYNYILRKKAVLRSLPASCNTVLEIGSGMSPIVQPSHNVVYCDISLTALKVIKKKSISGLYVVASGTHLPFRDCAFDAAVCSEVLEHIGEDRKAVEEIARVLVPSGTLVITFPHRNLYYSIDDVFVGHIRRYEVQDMKSMLEETGLDTMTVKKVLGPLEKITMICVTCFIRCAQKVHSTQHGQPDKTFFPWLIVPVFQFINRLFTIIVRLDAKIMPLKMASVVLMQAVKKPGKL